MSPEASEGSGQICQTPEHPMQGLYNAIYVCCVRLVLKSNWLVPPGRRTHERCGDGLHGHLGNEIHITPEPTGLQIDGWVGLGFLRS